MKFKLAIKQSDVIRQDMKCTINEAQKKEACGVIPQALVVVRI